MTDDPQETGADARTLYVPPTGDGPLDPIEQALVRALAATIVRQIREEAATETSTAL